jgi:hypothetical protein
MAAAIVSRQPLAAPCDGAESPIAVFGGHVGERLAVYVDGYPARVQEAIEEQFPALAHVVGPGAFTDLVLRYIERIPLRSYNLNDAGAELPRFLANDPLTAGLPFLPDLAQLEWHVARAFHAFEEPALDPRPLTHWTPEQWERALLRFQPGTALVTSDWPIREIWDCRDTPIETIDIDLNDRPDCVLVRRAGDAVVCESLDVREADALAALMVGHTIGSTIATLADRGEDPTLVSAWFTRWMTLGIVAGCGLS